MRFPAIVISIFTALFAYFYFSLITPFDATTARFVLTGLMAALFAAVLWVPLSFWRREDDEPSTLKDLILQWIAFSSMGLFSFVLIFALLRDLTSLVFSLHLRTPQGSGAVLGLAFLAASFGLYHARHGVKLKVQEVPLNDLPPELEGLKIAQISDLHVGPTIRRSFVTRVVGIVQSASPDLIVFTGDAVDGQVSELADEIAPLKGLYAPLGKFYCLGNHEYYWGAQQWIDQMKELGWIPLLNSHRVIEIGSRKFVVGGVTDPAATSTQQEGPDPARSIAGAPIEAHPKILLCHQPKFAMDAERAGYDLMLSGHTHGGQFFPWTLIAGKVHSFNAGLHRLGKLMVYVSRGTGYWGPPVRLGSPAEVTLLVLRNLNSTASV